MTWTPAAVRRATLADVAATTRVLDALPNVDIVYVSLLDATDQPPHLITLADFAATLANTTKPLIGPGVVNGAEAEAIVAMARALRGPELARYPPCVPFICPITPLRFPAALVDALTVVAQAGLPLEVITNPVMGVTAPYTIAGAVALGHAEVLAAAVMAHAVRPGLPILQREHAQRRRHADTGLHHGRARNRVDPAHGGGAFAASGPALVRARPHQLSARRLPGRR